MSGLVFRPEDRDEPEAMHAWFGLSYANYLVVPRVLIQAMSDDWQTRMARLLDELYETSRDIPQASEYRVQAVEHGRYARDPLPHYRRDRVAAQRIEIAMGQRARAGQP